MEIWKLLKELEDVVENRRDIIGLTFGFDHEPALDLIQKMRASLPDEFRQASHVTAESEKIVDGAREAAEHTLEEAKAEAELVTREARATAERLLRDAEMQAGRTTMAADASAKQQLAEAKMKADEALMSAQDEARKLISQNEVVRLATAQAREIIAAAEQEAREALDRAARETRNMHTGADEYAHGVMSDLERNVSELMGVIQRGRQSLEQRRPIAPAPVPAPPSANGGRNGQELAAGRR